MTIIKAQAARAEKALDLMVRHNGSRSLISRRQLIEQKVASGSVVTLRRNGERVLMATDGSWLDAKSITKSGLDYAERLERTA